MDKKAVITGALGQDGSFLCEQLVSDGYEVIGITQKVLSSNSQLIMKELKEKEIDFRLADVDLGNYESVSNFVREETPDKIFHMAAYHVSSEGIGNAEYMREQKMFNTNVSMTANILEAVEKYSPKTRVLTAGSCLMYDNSYADEQEESVNFNSKSLYGLAKIAENMLVNYYRMKSVFACTAILYNHESHRRSLNFVTRKIVHNLVKIKYGMINEFVLGNLTEKKDWGYAGDYAHAMKLMLDAKFPNDYIIASGEQHTISEFVQMCADTLGIENVEKHIIVKDDITTRNVNGELKGNSGRIYKDLGWRPKYSLEDIIREMVDWEIRALSIDRGHTF